MCSDHDALGLVRQDGTISYRRHIRYDVAKRECLITSATHQSDEEGRSIIEQGSATIGDR